MVDESEKVDDSSGTEVRDRPNPNLRPFNEVMNYLEISGPLRDEFEKSLKDESAKPLLHSKIHLKVEKGELNPLYAGCLLKALNQSTDRLDVQYMQASGKRKWALAESSEDPYSCMNVCWGDIPDDERAIIIQSRDEEQMGVQEEGIEDEQVLRQLLDKNTSVIGAAVLYNNRPFLLARLAKKIDEINGGNQGLKDLEKVYPSIQGLRDSKEVALKIVESFEGL